MKQKRKQKSKLLEEDFKDIEQEDQENLINIKKSLEDENPEHLKNQLHNFNNLIEIRHF